MKSMRKFLSAAIVFSKTDHDATFMHMKEDHMKNGQFQVGHNIQAATSNQYILDYALFPNPTDFKTFEPFLAQMKSRNILDKVQNIVADAGYGSEYNYSLLEEKYEDKDYFIPYTTYEKEQTRKYKNDPSGRQRQMHYNPDWQSLKTKAKEVLQSKEGKEIYGMRKNDVEPIFGHMKNVFGMRRAHLRGKEKVETDVGMMFLMMNLNKYWTREVRY